MQLYRAVDGLRKEEFEKIIICKPIVEIGRSMGYLPGATEKIDPYAKSFYDNLAKLVGKDRVPHIKSKIEFNAVNFVRGNTFDDNSVIILSEAQNLTLHEIISFVTRLPESSKLFINGDLHQSDIKNSGLSAFLEIIEGIDGIQTIYLDSSFQMRNKMITTITKNYYKYLKNGKKNYKDSLIYVAHEEFLNYLLQLGRINSLDIKEYTSLLDNEHTFELGIKKIRDKFKKELKRVNLDTEFHSSYEETDCFLKLVKMMCWKKLLLKLNGNYLIKFPSLGIVIGEVME